MTLPIACAQIACMTFDIRGNLEKADHYLREATRQGARLVLLPELLTTGYTYDHRLRAFAEPVGGPTTRWLGQRSRQFGCWVGAGIIEAAGSRVFDTFLLAGPAGEILAYRKQYPAFFEYLYFDCGQTLGVFETSLGRIGLMVCWDMVQPRLARCMAGRIDLLLICSAWPDLKKGNIPLFGVRHWLSRLPVHQPRRLAQRLQVPVAYCNMTGAFHTVVPWLGLHFRSEYVGRSSISSPDGQTLKQARREETILLTDVRLGKRRAA